MIFRVSAWFFSLALLTLSLGCSPPDGNSSTSGDTVPLQDVSTLSSGGVTAFGVGDVEFDMRIVASIAQKSEATNLRIAQSESINDRVTRVVADWFPPHPEEAWVTILVYSRKNYPAHAVLLETDVSVDGKVVLSYSSVGGPALQEPIEYIFDVLKYVEGTPETILVYAETRLTLYLETDLTTINPETPPEAPRNAKATLLSNSLRISFHE